MSALTDLVRYVHGGRLKFLQMVKQAALNGNEAARQWIDVFARLPISHQRIVVLEDVCETANVSPRDLVAIAVSEAMEFGTSSAEFIAAMTHPKLVARMTKSAMRIGGAYADIALRDRHALMQHHKFIPIPRNASVAVNVSANSSANAAAAAANEANPTVPSFSQSMASLEGAKDRVPRAIEAAREAD